MSGRVLLNLLNELRCNAFYLFCNEFDKCNNTGARMLEYIYHIILKFLKISFWSENLNILPSFT